MDPKMLELYFKYKLETEWGPYDLKNYIESGKTNVVLLDVRRSGEYEEGHIPNALNIPVGEIDVRIKEIPTGKYVVCYSNGTGCTLSTHAAMSLAKHGYLVKELTGGIEGWMRAGLPVDTGKAAGKQSQAAPQADLDAAIDHLSSSAAPPPKKAQWPPKPASSEPPPANPAAPATAEQKKSWSSTWPPRPAAQKPPLPPQSPPKEPETKPPEQKKKDFKWDVSWKL